MDERPTMDRCKWSREHQAALLRITRYDADWSIVGRVMDRSPRAAYRKWCELRARPLPIKAPGCRERVVEMYRDGEKVEYIASVQQVAICSVVRLARLAGLPPRRVAA